MTGFFTGGGASLSFGNPQDPQSMPMFGNRWRGGQILEEGKVQPQTDINTNQPIIRNGKVAEQLALPLLCDGSGPAAEAGMPTDERNPQDHTDTGRRVAYIKGALRYAIGDALRKAGAADLEVGGYLFMMWTGMGKTGNSKFIGRLWQVHYIRPTAAFLAQQQVPQGGYPQGAFPPHTAHAEPGIGAMPMQNGAPQHTGFAPTQQQSAAMPVNHQVPAQVPPEYQPQAPNPYGQHNPPGSPAANAAQQWAAQNGVGHPQAPIQTVGQMQNPAGSGAFRPDDNGWQQPQGTGPRFETPAAAQAWGAQAPQSAAPASNPWGQAPDPQQTPYGPPAQQGTPQPGTPAAGNPWGQ